MTRSDLITDLYIDAGVGLIASYVGMSFAAKIERVAKQNTSVLGDQFARVVRRPWSQLRLWCLLAALAWIMVFGHDLYTLLIVGLAFAAPPILEATGKAGLVYRHIRKIDIASIFFGVVAPWLGVSFPKFFGG